VAFIRDYSARSAMAGDPGLGKFFKRAFKPPKALRKFQPGKALARIGRVVAPFASFVPGVGGILGRLMPAVQRVAAATGIDEAVLQEALQARLEAMGVDLSAEGDPGNPPKPATKRKRAASGPKAKQAARTTKKAERRSRGKPTPKSPGQAVTPGGVDLDAALDELMKGGSVGSVIFAGRTGQRTKAKAPGLGFGRRRRINPANVKPLRRAIRRVEGFQKLVKSVERAYPRLRGSRSHSQSRGRGHRAGCRCAICARAA